MTADENTAHIVSDVVDIFNITDLLFSASEKDLDLRIPLDQVDGDHDRGRHLLLQGPDPHIDALPVGRHRPVEISVIQSIDESGITRMPAALRSVDDDLGSHNQ